MREILKKIVRFCSLLLGLPLLLAHYVFASLVGPDRALESTSQWLSLIPGVLGIYVRGAVLRVILDECHSDASIGFGVLLSQVRAKIESRVVIGPRCHLGLVAIREGALIGPGVQIPSGGAIHSSGQSDVMLRDQELVRSTVEIGRGAWVGAGSIVLANVGENTIVAAASVVNRPLPPNVVAGGNPARVIAKRPPLSAEELPHP